MKMKKSQWLKNRGYLHISPQIDVNTQRSEILNKVKSVKYVTNHAFYPLIHSTIKERRYKFDAASNSKGHSHSGSQTKKLRPLHYATHIDALIFGYYAEILQDKYEDILNRTVGLSDCVTAYRKIPNPQEDGKFKSTINFAFDVFNEIRTRSDYGCVVLKFDIKSYFSTINHKLLKKSWSNLLQMDSLPADHYNVFKAATKFSYILKDDLRVNESTDNKRNGFDEKKLAKIRKKGICAFYESNEDFRSSIKNGHLKIYKAPFRDKESGELIGIPQGLPISATLANLYLLEFDKEILSEIVDGLGAFYRRYSDDIVIVCQSHNADFIERKVHDLIIQSKVKISKEKTERFLFRNLTHANGILLYESAKISGDKKIARYPFTYL